MTINAGIIILNSPDAAFETIANGYTEDTCHYLNYLIQIRYQQYGLEAQTRFSNPPEPGDIIIDFGGNIFEIVSVEYVSGNTYEFDLKRIDVTPPVWADYLALVGTTYVDENAARNAYDYKISEFAFVTPMAGNTDRGLICTPDENGALSPYWDPNYVATDVYRRALQVSISAVSDKANEGGGTVTQEQLDQLESDVADTIVDGASIEYDTLKKIEDILLAGGSGDVTAAIAALKGAVTSDFDTLEEIEVKLNALQTAVDAGASGDVTAAINSLKGLPPADLDTLEKLANAIGNDPDFLTNLKGLPPAELDSLEKIANALNNDENFATTLETNIKGTPPADLDTLEKLANAINNNATFNDDLRGDVPPELDNLAKIGDAINDDPNFGITIKDEIVGEATEEYNTLKKIEDIIVAGGGGDGASLEEIRGVDCPEDMNTLQKLSTSLNDDPNFYTTIMGGTPPPERNTIVKLAALIGQDNSVDTLRAGVIEELDNLRKIALAINDDPNFYTNLIGTAPDELDSLSALAAAIDNDPVFFATIQQALDEKAPLNMISNSAQHYTIHILNWESYPSDGWCILPEGEWYASYIEGERSLKIVHPIGKDPVGWFGINKSETPYSQIIPGPTIHMEIPTAQSDQVRITNCRISSKFDITLTFLP